MIEFTMELASCVVAVQANFESSRAYCRDFLSAKAPELTVTVTPEDLALEREKNIQTDMAEGVPVRNLTDAQLEITAIQRKLAQAFFSRDILVFHGSAVAVDGVAYLFTAKSGTGKSTHTRLWRQMLGPRAVMINDDKPFLKITRDDVEVFGSPWNGKHRLSANISAPLQAICLLERGEQNEIVKISPREALPALLQQSSRPLDTRQLPTYMELLDKLSGRVSFYRLRCNMEPEAAAVSYEAMANRKT
jgi:hypothetical protein